MPSSLVRRLSSAASPLSLSKAKLKLRSELDPDKTLEVYTSVVSEHCTSPAFCRYAQDLTVKRLARARRFSDIETLIESHKKDSRITQELFLSTLIRSYGMACMFSHALSTYTQMDELDTPRSTISFNALLSACIQSRLFDKVPHLFDEMCNKYGIQPDKVSYGILVKAHCCMGSPELAIKTMEVMEEKGVEITVITFTTILDSLYKKGMVNEAGFVWDEMVKKGCIDTAAYNVRIMHVGGSDPEAIKGLIEEMTSLGLNPDTTSYNLLMACYCKLDRIDEAKKVFKDLNLNGIAPTAASFRTLIYHLSKSGRFVQGYRVFKESAAMNKIPDSETLKLLLEGIINEKRRKEASGVIRTLRKKFPAGSLGWLEQVVLESSLATEESSSQIDENSNK